MIQKPQESYQLLSNYSTQKEEEEEPVVNDSDQESLDPNNCSVEELRKKLEAIRDNKNLLEQKIKDYELSLVQDSANNSFVW